MKTPSVGDKVVIIGGPLGRPADDGHGYPLATVVRVHRNTARISVKLEVAVGKAYPAGAEALIDAGEWRYSDEPPSQISGCEGQRKEDDSPFKKTETWDSLLKRALLADVTEERGTVHNETRKGAYLSIRGGLSAGTWFVGIGRERSPGGALGKWGPMFERVG